MDNDDIIVQSIGTIKVIKYNRPKKKNAIDVNMYYQVADIFKEAANDQNVSLVVITGSGDFYSSGNDFKSVSPKGDIYSALKKFIEAFIKFPKLLVAVVNGPAIGIATTTLALCDIVFAAENSYFYTPFTKLGILPEGCSTFTFPRLMGDRKALELLVLNHKMSAREALECGFINYIYKPNELQNVWDKIQEVATLPTHCLIASKKLLRDSVKEKLIETNNRELEEIYKLSSIKSKM